MDDSVISSKLKIIITFLAIMMGLFQILSTSYRVLSPIELQNIHIFFAFTIIFLIALKNAFDKKLSFATKCYWIVMLVLAVFATAYIQFNYITLVERVGASIPLDLVVGLALVIVTLEATRSTFGWAIPILTVIGIIYMFVGPWLPGIFYHGGFTVERVISSLTVSFGGLYGTLLNVSATFVALFMIFGGILGTTGGGNFFMKLGLGLGGKFKSGPALAAVISSGLMGSINGSAVANVATTGVFTIPMMKDRGYKPDFAAAVEATASTGGMLLPPVMGVGAFVMAELTGIPYIKIAAAATIPAILYFLLVAITVVIRSNKIGLEPVKDKSIPKVSTTLKTGFVFFIPIIAIIYFMVKGYSPSASALVGIKTLIVIFFLRVIISEPKKIMRKEGWKPLIDGLEEGVNSLVGIAATMASIGILVQCIIATGLAHRLIGKILVIGDQPLIALFLTMAIALFFGMGVPTTASYIVLAVMAAPALVKIGLPLLPVHLFLYYFTIIGNVTPPVGSAAIVASRLAGADYNKTCIMSLKMSLSAFILPFVFIFRPELLGQGEFLSILEVVFTATIGLIAISAFFEKFLLKPTTVVQRIILGIVAVLLIAPLNLWISLGALAGFSYVVIKQITFKEKLQFNSIP